MEEFVLKRGVLDCRRRAGKTRVGARFERSRERSRIARKYFGFQLKKKIVHRERKGMPRHVRSIFCSVIKSLSCLSALTDKSIEGTTRSKQITECCVVLCRLLTRTKSLRAFSIYIGFVICHVPLHTAACLLHDVIAFCSPGDGILL